MNGNRSQEREEKKTTFNSFIQIGEQWYLWRNMKLLKKQQNSWPKFKLINNQHEASTSSFSDFTGNSISCICCSFFPYYFVFFLYLAKWVVLFNFRSIVESWTSAGRRKFNWEKYGKKYILKWLQIRLRSLELEKVSENKSSLKTGAYILYLYILRTKQMKIYKFDQEMKKW